MNLKSIRPAPLALRALAAAVLLAVAPAFAAWEPTKPVEFVVPAGTGGGADQMARFIQGVVAKNKLMNQPIIVVNKSGGAGAEGFLDVKGDKGNPHKIVITLSNLFTTPLATGVPFNWRDLTPVQMLALDQFVLWVNAESPYKTAKEYLDGVKSAPPNTMKMGGTGSKQEDQIITVMVEKAAGKKITYIPFKGGGDVAVQLVGNHIGSTVNNPIEAESHWRAGKLRALCVMDKAAMPYKTKLTATQSWADIPTCASAGLPVDYVMLRGIFMPPGVTPDQVAFYTDLFKKVRALPEWKDFMDKGAFNQTALSGPEFFDWLGKNEQMHRVLMKEAGFIAQ
jgi:putative tricarboxylic transport membrane protein